MGKLSNPTSFAIFLIPQTVGSGFQAGAQGDRRHGLEKRLGLVAFLEVVIRNARAQVVDVVKADVAGEPLEHPRQLVIRAALQRAAAAKSHSSERSQYTPSN